MSCKKKSDVGTKKVINHLGGSSPEKLHIEGGIYSKASLDNRMWQRNNSNNHLWFNIFYVRSTLSIIHDQYILCKFFTYVENFASDQDGLTGTGFTLLT